MKSLKSLVTERAKHIADAQGILGREKSEGRKLSAEENLQADGLLDKAGALDVEIDQFIASGKLNDRLNSMQDKFKDELPRQTSSSVPGVNPGNTSKGDQPLRIEFGKTHLMLAPGTPEFNRAQPDYLARFAQYLSGGRPESLGLQVGKESKGGYIAPPQFVAMVIKFLDDLVMMRELATVLPPMASAVSIGVPVYSSDPGDADWTAEVPSSDITEDDGMTFGKREFMPHLCSKLIKASRKMVSSAVLDILAWVAERMAYKFSITEEKAFLTGDGSQKPLGVFTASADGLPTSQDQAAAGSTTVVADDFINTLMKLKLAYQKNATWLVSRELLKIARKLKDSQGGYIWSGGFNGVGLVNGVPDTILGRPYRASEYVPNTFTTGKYVAALADWKALYWIGDCLDQEVQYLDQLFALRNQVGILGRKETDGAPVLPEAGTRLILA